jgi:hypothetical protein
MKTYNLIEFTLIDATKDGDAKVIDLGTSYLASWQTDVALAGAAIDVKLQGKLTPNSPWFDIVGAAFDETDLVSATYMQQDIIPTPFMRVVITGGTIDDVVNSYLSVQ